MESCSGGLLASTITDVPGSSAYFVGGYVAYTPEMKIALGVSAGVIEAHGTVSDECAAEMARAARERAAADVGVSVTGVAGPDELEGKPPGRVHIAVDGPGEAKLPFSYTYYQGREATKRRAVTSALAVLRRALLAAG
jgi:PncC family amidohydrolase